MSPFHVNVPTLLAVKHFIALLGLELFMVWMNYEVFGKVFKKFKTFGTFFLIVLSWFLKRFSFLKIGTTGTSLVYKNPIYSNLQ